MLVPLQYPTTENDKRNNNDHTALTPQRLIGYNLSSAVHNKHHSLLLFAFSLSIRSFTTLLQLVSLNNTPPYSFTPLFLSLWYL